MDVNHNEPVVPKITPFMEKMVNVLTADTSCTDTLLKRMVLDTFPESVGHSLDLPLPAVMHFYLSEEFGNVFEAIWYMEDGAEKNLTIINTITCFYDTCFGWGERANERLYAKMVLELTPEPRVIGR